MGSKKPITEAVRSTAGRSQLTYFVSRTLFLRSVGLVYLIAFFSYWVQYPQLFGCDGLEPVESFLEKVNKTGSVKWTQLPTLAWLHTHPSISLDTDTWMQFIALVGGCNALLVVLAVPKLTGLGLFVCWACYLSVFHVGQTFLSFQWDILLLEVGVLAVLWSPGPFSRTHSAKVAQKNSGAWLNLVDEGSFDAPSPLIKWCIRWLLFRLLFTSGVVKIQSKCPTWLGLSALEYHYATQCIPTPLAWWAHQLPPFVQQLSVAGTLWIQVPLGLLLLLPNWLGPFQTLVGVGLQIILQVLILLTGNYNFFNLITIIMCFAIIPDSTWHSLAGKLITICIKILYQ